MTYEPFTRNTISEVAITNWSEMDLTPNVDQMYQNPEPQKWHIFTPKFGVKIRVRIVLTVPPPPPPKSYGLSYIMYTLYYVLPRGGCPPSPPKKLWWGSITRPPPKVTCIEVVPWGSFLPQNSVFGTHFGVPKKCVSSVGVLEFGDLEMCNHVLK